MKKHNILIEESPIKNNTYETKETDNNPQMNNTFIPLNVNDNPNDIVLIFRNQLSNDISLIIDKSKIITINDVIDVLLKRLKVSKSESIIRLFFKGRPLQNDEKIENISR